MRSDRTRLLRGALAGAAASAIWAAQQPLDKRIFGVDYDDAELLGSFVTGDRKAPLTLPIGTAMHLFNGAVFGAVYAGASPAVPGPRALRGLSAGLGEGIGTWPLTRFLEGRHGLPQLWGSHRAFAQMLWRHALFGVLLGELERRLNPSEGEAAPPPEKDNSSSNGHGDVEHLVVARA